MPFKQCKRPSGAKLARALDSLHVASQSVVKGPFTWPLQRHAEKCAGSPARIALGFGAVRVANDVALAAAGHCLELVIRKRLARNGIQTGPFGQDPYTGQKMLQFSGPDGVKITGGLIVPVLTQDGTTKILTIE